MRRLLLAVLLVLTPIGSLAADSGARRPAGEESTRSVDAKKKADEADEKKPVVTKTIVVTATRSERSLSDVPLSVTVVGEDEIRSAPALTPDNLLRTIPGVNIGFGDSAVTSPTRTRLSMRGLGGSSALVLLDGVPIHDPYYGSVEWQRVPLDSIERIEVVRGAGASLFGNYALGGTINLITRPVSSSEVRADLSHGSFTTNDGRLAVDQKVSDALGLRLSYGRFKSDGYYVAVNPGPVDRPIANDTWNAGFRADYHPSARTTGTLKTNWSRSDLSQGTILSHLGRKLFDASVAIHHALGDDGVLSTTLFRQHENFDLVTTRSTSNSEYVSGKSAIPASRIGGSLEWSLQRRGTIGFVSAGLDLQQIKTDETSHSFDSSGALTSSDLISGQQRFAGVFAQASWRPIDRLEVLGSARLDYYKNSNGSDIVVGGATTTYPETTTTELDPRVSFRYALDDHSALRGAAYRAFEAPTLRDLYRNAQIGRTIILGNPNLEPQTLVGGEIGYELSTARAHWTINVYRSDIDGLQVRTQVEGQPSNVVHLVNLGKGRSEGIESMFGIRLTRNWRATFDYTYSDSTVVSSPADPSLEGNLVPDVPPHIGTIGVEYRGDDGLAIDVRGRVVSQSYGDAANSVPSPPHRIVDMSISRPINSWLDLFARGENIFDETYYYYLSSTSSRAAEPRNLMAGVRIHIPTGGGK